MFTCVEILPESRGFFVRLQEKIKPPEPVKEYVQVRGATPFLRLKVKENHIDWRKISMILTTDERKILFSSDVKIPDNIGISRCEPQSLGLNMMVNTFLNLAEKAGKPREISVSVYDKDGAVTSRISELVPFVRNISVYTEKIREYFYLSSKIMKDSGMSIKINEYSSHAFPEKIIIADKYSKDMKSADLIFLSDSSVISYNTVTGEGIYLEDELKSLKSDDTDELIFASALYEYNNARFLGGSDFSHLNLAGREIREESILERLVKTGNT